MSHEGPNKGNRQEVSGADEDRRAAGYEKGLLGASTSSTPTLSPCLWPHPISSPKLVTKIINPPACTDLHCSLYPESLSDSQQTFWEASPGYGPGLNSGDTEYIIPGSCPQGIHKPGGTTDTAGQHSTIGTVTGKQRTQGSKRAS